MSFVTTDPEALDYRPANSRASVTRWRCRTRRPLRRRRRWPPPPLTRCRAAGNTIQCVRQPYQQVSAEATAINQAFVQMLGLSGDSYGSTEASNSAATGATGLGGFSILGQLTQFGQFGILPGAMSDGSMVGLYAGSPLLGSLSNFMSLAQSGGGAGAGAAGAAGAGLGDLGGLSLANAAAPAGVGTARCWSPLAKPRWWAGCRPAELDSRQRAAHGRRHPDRGGGLDVAAGDQSAPVNTVPGGVPSMAAADRTSGLGGPRYGMKSKVMPKPTVI